MWRLIFNRHYWVLALMLVLASCAEEDNEQPEVFLDAPVQNATVSTGGTLHVEATFSDNEGLAQYRIKVLKNFIGPYAKMDTVAAWDHVEIGDLSGKQQTLSTDIGVSAEAAAGDYYLLVSCVDINNWEGYADTVHFSVVNTMDTEPPLIQLNSPSDMQEFNVGDTILLSILVSDNLKVLQARGVVKSAADSSKVFENISDINDISGLLYDNAPTNAWAAGTYNIYYTAIDSVNNQTELVVPIVLN